MVHPESLESCLLLPFDLEFDISCLNGLVDLQENSSVNNVAGLIERELGLNHNLPLLVVAPRITKV